MAIIEEFSDEGQNDNVGTNQVETNKAQDEKKPEKNVEKEKKNLLVPNNGNGLDMEDHSWTQTLEELTLTIPVPPGTKSRNIVCEIKKKSLKVALKGQENPILDGELFATVKVDDCFWNLEDNKIISVLMTKFDRQNWWKSLLVGGPEIDTQKAEPEPSRLGDLDGETRSVVEKMMFDQRQKQMGLKTSDEIEKEGMLKKFMAQNPNMDFSNMKMM
ncbi:protein BOBBER 1-like [Mercurialis annua]|uniref:protein BOBBER 1-like n=1 Tax=Mercurialis annua TaxID=3986 RepID=UPI00215F733A|nr:protein BOBBER 1-like [Mercurialis annua]